MVKPNINALKRATLGASTSLICLVAASAASAQDAANAGVHPIDYCRENTDGKKERIVCLEAALVGLMGAPSTDQAVSQSSTVDQPEEQAVASAEPEYATGIGAEQVERRNRKIKPDYQAPEKAKVEVTARITEYATTSLGKMIFFLDNGQIWRQRRSDKTRISMSSKRDYTVTIKEGMISGYRLKVNELNKSLVAERIK